MKKFILSRTDDYLTRSKAWILGYAFLFWLVTRIIAAATLAACIAIYGSAGISPESLTAFGGSPDQFVKIGSPAFVLFSVLVVAPVLEEGLFRLGLSFKKWQVALAAALIPIAVLWQYMWVFRAWQCALCLVLAAAVFCGIYFGTRQAMWSRLRSRHLVAASWLTAAAFGALHLMAFSTLSWSLLPYCLCVVLIPFFGGCACTYLRVNLGFWWGVAMHVFNNLPAVMVLLAS